MQQEDIKLLNDNGWVVECESPFEIRHTDHDKSFASNFAAEMILGILKRRGKSRNNINQG